MTGGARLSSLTPRSRRRRAHRRRLRPRRWQQRPGTGPASSCGCSGGSAARRGALVRRRRGATAEARRRSVAAAVSDCEQRGEERGKSQWRAAVQKRAEGGAGEACTSRSPAARRGGAPVDPERWGFLGRNKWCWSVAGGEGRLLVQSGGLGGAYIAEPTVHRGLVRRRGCRRGQRWFWCL